MFNKNDIRRQQKFVKAGARKLDELVSDWFLLVNLDIIDSFCNSDLCICGQLYREQHGHERLNSEQYEQLAYKIELGFVPYTDSQTMLRMWKHQVKMRKKNYKKVQQEKNEVFSKVVNGLLDQGEAARLDPKYTGNHCRYRVERYDEREPRVLKCAAGQLIPDEDMGCVEEGRAAYNDTLAHDAQNQPTAKYFASKYSRETCIMIQKCQSVHDDAKPLQWGKKFLELYRNFNINVPQVKARLEGLEKFSNQVVSAYQIDVEHICQNNL